jgi:hypothetical protein
MNIDFFKRSLMKFYKRGFITGFLVLTFMLVIDQFLQNPLFFSKITSIRVFIYIVSTIFFAAVFCGLLAVIFLGVVTIVTKK